jgi:hypothetical protein
MSPSGRARPPKKVTSVQFGVLSVLARTPGASQTELCAQLDLDRSTIADIVARLERHGLSERIRDAGTDATFRRLAVGAGPIIGASPGKRWVGSWWPNVESKGGRPP